MIQLQDLRYTIGDRVLFDRLDWVLSPGDRVALVGPNGAGKTTLLRVMLGELRPDSGARVLARGTRLGYLPQEAAETFEGTVLGRAMEAHQHVLAMREELDELHASLSGISDGDERLEALLERAGELQHHLELHDEHALEPEARRVLTGLGFSRADQDRPLAEFSGGWRMRTALAALLLTDPTLLFLDEPTNHLDLPAMEWLEDYLEDFHGGLVVVSHDRVFLDRVATEVRELDLGALSDYAMTFSRYLDERELRRERIEAENVQVEKRIAQLSHFVERFGAKNTKASQAQSKRKMIARLEKQRVVLPHRPRRIRFSFPNPPHAGRTLVRLRDVSFGYGARDVFAGAGLEIARDDKVAIVGANGAGKTTLLRVLAAQLEPRGGTRESYPHTRLGYFAQHAAETLTPSHTVLEALEEVAPPEWRPRLRNLLGNFLFSGDDVLKPCRVLSGGERQRVALSRILLAPANLLLLDEPTHHLDLAGKEVLEEALEQYPGAIVVVTHDRSLMARLTTRVIEVNDGRVRLYPGGYDDYEQARIARAAGAAAPEQRGSDGRVLADARERGRGAEAAAASPGRGDRAQAREPGKRAPADARAARGRGAEAEGARKAPPSSSSAAGERGDGRRPRAEQQRRANELKRVEREIEAREQRVRALETQLADPEVYHDGARAKELVSEYERLRAELESLWQRMGEL